METWIGIDISKDTFDAAYERDGKKSHAKFRNDTAGFRSLVKWAPEGSKSDAISIAKYGREKALKGMTAKAEFVAIACKLLKTAYALMIKRQKYEADYKTNILQKAS